MVNPIRALDEFIIDYGFQPVVNWVYRVTGLEVVQQEKLMAAMWVCSIFILSAITPFPLLVKGFIFAFGVILGIQQWSIKRNAQRVEGFRPEARVHPIAMGTRISALTVAMLLVIPGPLLLQAIVMYVEACDQPPRGQSWLSKLKESIRASHRQVATNE